MSSPSITINIPVEAITAYFEGLCKLKSTPTAKSESPALALKSMFGNVNVDGGGVVEIMKGLSDYVKSDGGEKAAAAAAEGFAAGVADAEAIKKANIDDPEKELSFSACLSKALSDYLTGQKNKALNKTEPDPKSEAVVQGASEIITPILKGEPSPIVPSASGIEKLIEQYRDSVLKGNENEQVKSEKLAKLDKGLVIYRQGIADGKTLSDPTLIKDLSEATGLPQMAINMFIAMNGLATPVVPAAKPATTDNKNKKPTYEDPEPTTTAEPTALDAAGRSDAPTMPPFDLSQLGLGNLGNPSGQTGPNQGLAGLMNNLGPLLQSVMGGFQAGTAATAGQSTSSKKDVAAAESKD
jgi:hypothetical protein